MTDRLVGQRSGTGNYADASLLMNVSRHDADLYLIGRNDPGAIRPDEQGLSSAHPVARRDHVAHRDTFGDADDEIEFSIDGLVDGAGGKSVFPRMWERMRPIVDGSFVVTLEQTKQAMRMMAERARVIAEGAGALALAAALTGRAGSGPIVAVVSGGNIDLKKFCEIIESTAS